MTDEAVCLRCDWRGETRGRTCPNCGVELFRAAPRDRGDARRRRLRRRRTAVEAPAEPAAEPVVASVADVPGRRDPEASRPSSRWQGWAIIGVLVVAAAVLVVSVRRATPAARTIPADLTGRLVFATDAPGEGSRLFVWDLTEDRVRPGPRVDGVIELLDADRAGRGWIGLTLELPDGVRAAAILRFLGPDDLPALIDGGDLVAWSADGDRFVTATTRPDGPGCRNEIRVIRYGVDPDARATQQFGQTTCERVIGLARGSSQTYVTLRGPRGTRIVDTLGGAGRTVLDGHSLVSASFTGALLVVPESTGDEPPSGPGAIYLEALLGRPLAYEADGGPFVIERFLAWSHDASRAAVIGHSAAASGLFVLDATVANDLAEPEFVRELVSPEAAAPSERFGWFVVDSGRLVLVRTDGSVRLLPLPEGVPGPSGPLVWLP